MQDYAGDRLRRSSAVNMCEVVESDSSIVVQSPAHKHLMKRLPQAMFENPPSTDESRPI